MFKWLEKFVIKRIIKRISKELPELKEKALEYWKDNKDEIIEIGAEVCYNSFVRFVVLPLDLYID